MNLENKVVVITGASKGLGKATAEAFVNQGAKVIISARSKKELGIAAKKISAIPFVADVTKEKEVMKLARFAKQKFRKIDIWVNNAGITIPHSSLQEIDPKRVHEMMEVNFFGTFYGSRAAYGIMKRQRQGTIVNIISMSALVGRPRSLAYSASKWATRGFTEGLRMALKPEHISIVMVHPGGIKTTIFGKRLPAGYEDWMEPSYVAREIIKNLKRGRPKEEIIVNKS